MNSPPHSNTSTSPFNFNNNRGNLVKSPPKGLAGTTDNRIPPNNLEAEKALLGAMFMTSHAIADAMEAGIQEDHFYSPAHARIFKAVSALYQVGQPVDGITVANKLKEDKSLESVGGDNVLLDIQSSTPAAGRAQHYAEIIINHALLRRLIENSYKAIDIAYNSPSDVNQAIDEAESLIYSAASDRLGDSAEHIHPLLGQALTRMEELYARKEEIIGLRTGYNEYDKLLSGLQPSSLVVVGGRPSVGKTSFALGMALNAAIESDATVLFFSMEMSKLELAQRMVSIVSKVEHKFIRNGTLRQEHWEKISHAMQILGSSKIWIDDTPALTTTRVRAKARRFKHKESLGLIVIDYLQIMSPTSSRDSRAVEVAEMSRDLKILARELECPVVALSQLSRSLENRTDKRPMLSDLRESGAIEQDADVVTFLYRDELYVDDSPDQGLAEVIVAKHRAGPTGNIKLSFMKEHSHFANIETEGWAYNSDEDMY